MKEAFSYIALLLVVSQAHAQTLPSCQVQCYQGLPEAPVHISSSGHVLDLAEPTQYCACNVEIDPQTKIVTHGFPLTIYAENRLKIGAGASVAAFVTPVAASGVAGGNGANGGGYERGPDTEGNCEGCDGMNGGAGGDGHPGANGFDGGAAGAIHVMVGAQLEGVLILDNSGQAGGDGGHGGNGGNGGDGQQGGRGKDGTFDCESGPGHGGQGGQGGNAGRGGNGGIGGQGGSIEVDLPTQHDVDQFKATVTNLRLDGGRGGLDGQHGSPGAGGHGGFGGRGNHKCRGEENSRLTADAGAGKNAAQLGYPSPTRKRSGGDGQLVIGVFKLTPENPSK